MNIAWLLSLQMGLYALMWLMAALVLREERPAIWHWLGYALSAMVCMGLLASRGPELSWLNTTGASATLLLSLILARRGAELFLHVVPNDRFYGVVLLIALVSFAWAGSEHTGERIAVSGVLSIVVLAGAIHTCLKATVSEFGRQVALLAAAPVVGMIAVHVFTTWLAVTTAHDPSMLTSGSLRSFGASAVTLASAAAFNFLFLGLLVKRLVTHLRLLSHSDPLTGLLNRRAMDARLQLEWLRWRRDASPFMLVAIDIDHFKRINDAHGHDTGDQVLLAVSQRLSATLRGLDALARMGGEEFVVLAPQDVGAKTPELLAERLRRALVEAPIVLSSGLQLVITASFGVSQPLPADTDPSDAMRRADDALYAAKNAGRNRVMVAPSGQL